MPKSILLAFVVAGAGLCLSSHAFAQVSLDARMRGGRIHYDGGRYLKAEEQFRKALDAYGTNADTVRAHILIWLGLSEARVGELDSARTHLAAAHAVAPAMTERLKTEKRWTDLLATLNRDVADSLAAFDAGRASAERVMLVPFSRRGLWGFADASGNIVIAPQYDAVREFHEGLAAVMWLESIESPDTAYDITMWGYIDTDGDTAIGFQYDTAGDFSNGSAVVVSAGKKICIDRSGKEWEPEEPGFPALESPESLLVSECPETSISFWQGWAIVRETPTEDGDMPAQLMQWKDGKWMQVASTREGFFYSSSIIEYVPGLTPEGREALGLLK